mgnify:CR=1 FL=1
MTSTVTTFPNEYEAICYLINNGFREESVTLAFNTLKTTKVTQNIVAGPKNAKLDMVKNKKTIYVVRLQKGGEHFA